MPKIMKKVRIINGIYKNLAMSKLFGFFDTIKEAAATEARSKIHGNFAHNG